MEFCVNDGGRSLSDDGLLLKVGAAEANVSMKNNTLKKSTSSYNFKGFISDEDDSYNRLFQCGQSIDKVKYILSFKIKFNLFYFYF